MAHKLPDLPYSYDALEPYYDEQTVRIHHDLHHKGYVDGLNKAEEALDRAREQDDYALVKHWERIGFSWLRTYTAYPFWDNMAPAGQEGPDGELKQRIDLDFGSVETLKTIQCSCCCGRRFRLGYTDGTLYFRRWRFYRPRNTKT